MIDFLALNKSFLCSDILFISSLSFSDIIFFLDIFAFSAICIIIGRIIGRRGNAFILPNIKINKKIDFPVLIIIQPFFDAAVGSILREVDDMISITMRKDDIVNDTIRAVVIEILNNVLTRLFRAAGINENLLITIMDKTAVSVST